MTRPKIIRRVNFEPEVTYFKPRGVPLSSLKEIDLTIDELEAIRLKNYKRLEQIECAKRMTISQSTLQRILTSANKKIADALINGKAIKIEGGVIKMNNEKMPVRPNPTTGGRKFKCEECKYEWEEEFGTGKKGIEMSCPKCKSKLVHRIDSGGHGFGRRPWGYKEKK
ncbi:MAG: DUF134 domain-containing protein [Candidatus Andersenbacteria bacterium]|nr:DUF134 domain-containing protein [Candidatus Andersenbacteria bacterium]